MIHYLRERLSWILYYLGTVCFVNALILLDPDLSPSKDALIYLNGILLISFCLFIYWRYHKETRLLKQIQEEAASPTMNGFRSIKNQGVLNQDLLEALIVIEDNYRHDLTKLREAHYMEHQFIDAWVHEVKAPLTAMKLAIDNDPTHPMMKRVEQEWLRIHLLIEEQLYISRLADIEKDFLVAEHPLKTIIYPEIKQLKSWFLEKNIAIEIELQDEEMNVLTDVKWAQFIFRQILTNAIKYSPFGSEIVITGRTKDGYSELIVKDQGKGVSSADLPRLFERGYTGQTGRKTNAATGLGLFLAKEVGQHIGCSIAVKSAIQQGTEVTMTFSKKNDYDSLYS